MDLNTNLELSEEERKELETALEGCAFPNPLQPLLNLLGFRNPFNYETYETRNSPPLETSRRLSGLNGNYNSRR